VRSLTDSGVELDDGTKLQVPPPLPACQLPHMPPDAPCRTSSHALHGHGLGSQRPALHPCLRQVATSQCTGPSVSPRLPPQADIVVLATGYRATARSLLPQQLQAAAGYKGDNQWLYRCQGWGWGAALLLATVSGTTSWQ
jgi:hypothetical protein